MEKATQVYVIEQRHGYCKVGVSANFPERLNTVEMQGGFKAKRTYTSNPLLNGFSVERLAHKQLEAFREIGEWFSASFEDAVTAVQRAENEKGIEDSQSNRDIADEQAIDDFLSIVTSIMCLPEMERYQELAKLYQRMSQLYQSRYQASKENRSPAEW